MAEIGEDSKINFGDEVKDRDPQLDQSDKALDKYKPCGMTGIEFMGHEFHISELLLGVFLLMSIVCMFLAVAGSGIPGIFFASMLLITSGVSLVVLWNYASIDTLAKLAARYARAAELYDVLSQKLETENKRMGAENLKFAAANKELEGTVNGLWKDVGIVDTATADLGSILRGFRDLTDTADALDRYQQELSEDNKAFGAFQRQRLLTNAKHQLKRRLRATFDDVDSDASGSISGKELPTLKRIVRKDLPDVKDVDKVFDLDGDGVIKKWELMDACDTLLDQVFTVDYERKNGEIKTISA